MSKFNTIQSSSESLFKDKNSKFFGYAFPLVNKEDISDKLEWVKKEHHQARHFCLAYRVGLDGNDFRANDDGEPSGSAGKPILGQIDSFELTNVLIIVVRYFGGTKLGVPGLIQAYRTASRMAIENAKIVERELHDSYQITCEYKNVPIVMDFLKKQNVRIVEKDFGSEPRITISIPQSASEVILGQLQDLRISQVESI